MMGLEGEGSWSWSRGSELEQEVNILGKGDGVLEEGVVYLMDTEIIWEHSFPIALAQPCLE